MAIEIDLFCLLYWTWINVTMPYLVQYKDSTLNQLKKFRQTWE